MSWWRRGSAVDRFTVRSPWRPPTPPWIWWPTQSPTGSGNRDRRPEVYAPAVRSDSFPREPTGVGHRRLCAGVVRATRRGHLEGTADANRRSRRIRASLPHETARGLGRGDYSGVLEGQHTDPDTGPAGCLEYPLNLPLAGAGQPVRALADNNVGGVGCRVGRAARPRCLGKAARRLGTDDPPSFDEMDPRFSDDDSYVYTNDATEPYDSPDPEESRAKDRVGQSFRGRTAPASGPCQPPGGFLMEDQWC